MNTKFKRHQLVRIIILPNHELIEYHDNEESGEEKAVKKGMHGRINILLPNGQYHVEILDEKGNIIAYAPFNEEDLESI